MTTGPADGVIIPLVPKLHLGTLPVPRETPFRADSTRCYRAEIGNGLASANALPNGVWEGGNQGVAAGAGAAAGTGAVVADGGMIFCIIAFCAAIWL